MTIYFWGHTFHKEPTVTCFSQWYPSPITEKGVIYPTAEHYMMAKKAELFHDNDTLGLILRAEDPREAKALGRQVKNFNTALWNKHCRIIVEQGNYLKFSQNKKLGKFLLSTGDDIIAEASPYDQIWGIGITADEARKGTPWRGTNYLGEALMNVRKRIAPLFNK